MRCSAGRRQSTRSSCSNERRPALSDLPGEAYLERFNQIARSLFAVRSGEPLRELAPELGVNVILENEPPDYAILGGKVWWSSKLLTSPAVAAKFSQIDVFNPVGSGLI